MTRVVWFSDPHLNFMGDQAVRRFLEQVREHQAPWTLVTGDISDAPNLHRHLSLTSLRWPIPVCSFSRWPVTRTDMRG